MGWFDGINIVNLIPETISSWFVLAGDMMRGAYLFFMNVYMIFLILLFFGMVALMLWLPIKLYPLYVQNRQFIDKIIYLKRK